MRLRWLRVAAAVAALASFPVACVSTNEVGGNNNATPTTTTIPPETGTFGTDVSYGPTVHGTMEPSVVATVIDVAPFDQSPNGVPRIKVVMRAENLSGSVQRNPDVELLCDESTHTGDWFLGSTWEPNVVLPVNAITQGEVIVGFPMKGDNPEYAVVTCTSPKLRLTLVDAKLEVPKVVVIPIDDSVIADAIRRPRGPKLPLPPRGS